MVTMYNEMVSTVNMITATHVLHTPRHNVSNPTQTMHTHADTYNAMHTTFTLCSYVKNREGEKMDVANDSKCTALNSH